MLGFVSDAAHQPKIFIESIWKVGAVDIHNRMRFANFEEGNLGSEIGNKAFFIGAHRHNFTS